MLRGVATRTTLLGFVFVVTSAGTLCLLADAFGCGQEPDFAIGFFAPE